MGTELAGFLVAQERRIMNHATTPAASSDRPGRESYGTDPQSFFRDVGGISIRAHVHWQARVAAMLNAFDGAGQIR